MLKRRIHVLTILIALLAAPLAAAKKAESLAANLDQIASRFYDAARPGAAIIVLKDGKPLLRKGYGMADLELGVPIAPDMVFRIGSVTKQFTAVAILQLVQQGKIALDDDITKFLPDYPTAGRKITVQHLLTHTSGIKSFTSMPSYAAGMRQDISVKEMIDRFKGEPLEFNPGERWNYSNSGYFLLGAIIERASGMTYEQYLEKNVFQALGMKRTYYGSESRLIPRRVRGYEALDDGSGFRNSEYLSMTQPYAAGSLLSTVDDLARWDAALLDGKLVDRKLLDRAWTGHKLPDGAQTKYGYGWSVDDFHGFHFIEHGGGINGFASFVLRIPEEKIFVAVLTNDASHEPEPEYVAAVLATTAAGKPFEQKPVSLTAEELERYAGVYKFDSGAMRTIVVENGRIFSQRSGGPKFEILPVGDGKFIFRNAFTTLTFSTGADGKIAKVVFGGKSALDETGLLTAEKPIERKEIALDAEKLARYAGRFELAPGFVLTITSEGDRLFGQATGQPKTELFAQSDTEFFLKVVDAQLTFTLGADGRASALVLHQGGEEMSAKKLD